MRRPLALGLVFFSWLSLPPAMAAEVSLAAIPNPAARLQALVDYEKRFPDGEDHLATLLGLAKDKEQPDGVRVEAMKAYARMARRMGAIEPAMAAIKKQQGAIPGLGDPTWDSLALLGPAALPALMDGMPLCSSKYASDKAVDDHVFRATTVRLVVAMDPVGAQSESMALAKGLRCRHRLARRAYAQALSTLPSLDTPTLTRVRRFLAADANPETRSLAAAVIAERKDTSAASLEALSRALSDRAELVRLSAAKALWTLDRKEKATPVLEKLSTSRNAELAQLAKNILASAVVVDDPPELP